MPRADEVRKALGQHPLGQCVGMLYTWPPIEALKRRYQVYFPKLEGAAEANAALLPFVEQILGPEALMPPDALAEL